MTWLWPAILQNTFCMWNEVRMISKYAEKLNMLAEKRQFTEIFPFKAYRRLEKLELTKENEYDFRNQHLKII